MSYPAPADRDFYRVQTVSPDGNVKTLIDHLKPDQANYLFTLWLRDFRLENKSNRIALRLTRAFHIIETTSFVGGESHYTTRDAEVIRYVKL